MGNGPVTLLRMKFSLILWYTLTYASGKLGIGCIYFKYAGMRCHTLGQKEMFQHVEKCWAYVTVWIIR